jgi:hypothetical protein
MDAHSTAGDRVEVDLEGHLIVADLQAEQTADCALIVGFASWLRSLPLSLPIYTASHSLGMDGFWARKRRTVTGRPVAWVVPLTRSSVYSVGPTMHRRNCAGSTGQRA